MNDFIKKHLLCFGRQKWIAVVLIMIFSSTAGLASAEDICRFERMWPTVRQPWYFSEANGIAVGRDGVVYVADTGNHRILSFTKEGHMVTQWGGKGSTPGKLDQPSDIVVDTDGFLYVADYGNSRIQKFDTNGRFIAQATMPYDEEREVFAPTGIAIGDEGSVYVTDVKNHCILFFDSGLNHMGQWGGRGSQPGQFKEPQKIATDASGNVYVSDTGNKRIQKFDSHHNFVTLWDGSTTLLGSFEIPLGLRVDKNGTLFVADEGHSTIFSFSTDGTYQAEWGTFGAGPPDFLGVCGLSTAPDGTLFVTNIYQNRVQHFTQQGVLLAVWESSGDEPGWFRFPVGMGIDSTGNLYVADQSNSRIQKFSPDGKYLDQWGQWGDGQGQFAGPVDVAAGLQDEQFYVVEEWGDRIQVFDNTFVHQGFWGTGTSGSGTGEFHGPGSITVDSQGFVYVLDRLNLRVQKFDPKKPLDPFLAIFGSPGTGDGQFGGVPGTSGSGPAGIAVGASDQIYVCDTDNHRIQIFNTQGVYQGQWGESGSLDGQFYLPEGIAVDNDGAVWVADTGNHRVQKFTDQGQYIGKFGKPGSAPGQFSEPRDIIAGKDNRIYVAEYQNNRVQVLQQFQASASAKAIIVAGGGPYPGNNLWPTTQMSANAAYRTLTFQGFTKETICYLSSDTQLDLDNNGEPDDVDDDAVNENLAHAITQWAKNASDLVLYLVDHGGNGTFRMNASQTLSSAQLDAWLDSLQQTTGCRITIIYDACESGSFLSAMTPVQGIDRITITSTSPDESAYFIAQGSVSFSSYFWTHIFNGQDLKTAFNSASSAINMTVAHQNPLIDADGNGQANETADFERVKNVFIGNGTMVSEDAPVIGNIFDPISISNGATAMLTASQVTDSDGIARVWAIIRPPKDKPVDSNNPVRELPFVDLLPIGNDGYEQSYDGFDIEGTYHISVYARDKNGNTSPPSISTVIVSNPLRQKAVIVCGASVSDEIWPAVAKNAQSAYRTLVFQGYRDEDIYYLSPETVSPGIDGTPDLSNVNYAISTWAKSNTRDLLVYMIGKADNKTFYLNSLESVSASYLDGLLDVLQTQIPGNVTVIYDASGSGSFLPWLTPPAGKHRIVIASTAAKSPAYFLSDGDISFSGFFWSRILNGMDIHDSFVYAKNAIRFCQGQIPLMDDNGNGIGNEKTDGLFSTQYQIGFGIVLAGDDPVIGTVVPGQTLLETASGDVWADGVATTGTIDRVWAVIQPPSYLETLPEQLVTQLPIMELARTQAGRYQGLYTGFNIHGSYKILIFAKDQKGNISIPAETWIVREDGCVPGKGDINQDCYLDLEDVQTGLKVMAALPNSALHSADVSEDGKIDVKEVIYLLQQFQAE